MIEISPAEARKQPGESLAVLRRELSRLAMRNRRFRSGELDYQEIDFWHGDRSTPTRQGMPLLLEQGYHFEVTRFRSSVMRPYLEYDYSYTGRLSHASLPEHIAVDQYGLSPHDAVIEAGDTTVKKTVHFRYNSLTGRLGSCEKVQYFDSSHDEIAFACTCPIDHEDDLSLTRSAGEVYDQEVDDDDETDIENEVWVDEEGGDDPATQFFSTAARLREFIEDDAERERVAHTSLQKNIDSDSKQRMVSMAIGTARSIYRELDQL